MVGVNFVATSVDLIEFKFINGATWNASETSRWAAVGADGFGGQNRQWVITGADVIGPYCFGACAACESNLDYPGCTDPNAINFDARRHRTTVLVNTVVFQVDASEFADAQRVYLAGSFHQDWNPGTTPMQDAGDGLWVVQATVTGSETRWSSSTCRHRLDDAEGCAG